MPSIIDIEEFKKSLASFFAERANILHEPRDMRYSPRTSSLIATLFAILACNTQLTCSDLPSERAQSRVFGTYTYSFCCVFWCAFDLLITLPNFNEKHLAHSTA